MIEDYATKLQINKPIADEYVKLIDVVNQKTAFSTTNLQGLLTDHELDEIRHEIEHGYKEEVTFEDTTARTNENRDDIDDIEETVKTARHVYFGWLRELFTDALKHPDLQDEGQFYTCVYDRHKNFMFRSYYDKNKDPDNPDLFTPAERSKVAAYMLMECAYIEQATEASTNFSIERLLLTTPAQVFTHAYPLHDCALKTEKSKTFPSGTNMRSLLYQYWARYKKAFQYQPLDQIRSYLGEQIALYFAWLGFYNLALLYASIFGIIVVLYGWITLGSNEIINDYCNNSTDISKTVMCPSCSSAKCSVWYLQRSCNSIKISHFFDNNFSMPYTIVMALWSALFIEFWKRKTFKLTYDWDLTDIDEDGEPARPKYRQRAAQQGKLKPNPVTLIKERYGDGF